MSILPAGTGNHQEPTRDDSAIRQRGLRALSDDTAVHPVQPALNGIPVGRPVIAAPSGEPGYQIGYIHPPNVDMSWMAHAACAGMDTDLFFPNRGTGKANPAKLICTNCPVVQECGEYGMDEVTLTGGVFGGTTAAQRRLQAKPPTPEIH